jgi:4-hydroxy-tetrahydrodipicolinate synthase
VVAVKQANDDELGPIEGLRVLAGNDGTFLPDLEMGGPGGILVASHIVGPELREIYDAVQGGDLDRAREIDAKLRPIYEMISQVNPIPIKAALELLGICSCRARLPIVEADEDQKAEIRRVLEAHGLLARSAA